MGHISNTDNNITFRMSKRLGVLSPVLGSLYDCESWKRDIKLPLNTGKGRKMWELLMLEPIKKGKGEILSSLLLEASKKMWNERQV